MADEDQALFEAATADEAPETVEVPEQSGQPRDESGRFAPKQKPEQSEQVTQPEPAPQEPVQEPNPQAQGIPPWRLKEEMDARRQYEAEVYALRQQIAQFQRQPKEPEKIPDLYEDPNAFVDHGVRQHVDPIRGEIANLREYYSRERAVDKHGIEKVTEAYQALDQALRSRDPEAAMVFERAKNSIDPFGDIMQWHTRRSVVSQVGPDPNAWFEKQLEERLKDPSHQAKLLERIRGNVQQQPNRPSMTQLPPSLNRATASAPPGDDDDDGSEAGLLKSALRR